MRSIAFALVIVWAVPLSAVAQTTPSVAAASGPAEAARPDRESVVTAIRDGRAAAIVEMKKRIRVVVWRLGTLTANREGLSGRNKQRMLALFSWEEREKQNELAALEERLRMIEAGEIDCGLPALDIAHLDVGKVGRIDSRMWMVDDLRTGEFTGRPVVTYYSPTERGVARNDQPLATPCVIRGIDTANLVAARRTFVAGDFWVAAKVEGDDRNRNVFVLQRFVRGDIVAPTEHARVEAPVPHPPD